MPRVSKVTYRPRQYRTDVPHAYQVVAASTSAGPRLDGHDRLVDLLDELVGVGESSPYLRTGGTTREQERQDADTWGTRELALWILDTAGITPTLQSDAYLIARARAWLEAAVHDMGELAATEVPAETAALFTATTPATASAREAFVARERGLGPGLTREQFLERERGAWKQDTWSAPCGCAADGTRLDEIDREIERNLRGEDR